MKMSDFRSKTAERGTHMHKDFLFHHLSVCFPTQHQQYYFTIIGLRCSCQYFQYALWCSDECGWIWMAMKTFLKQKCFFPQIRDSWESWWFVDTLKRKHTIFCLYGHQKPQKQKSRHGWHSPKYSQLQAIFDHKGHCSQSQGIKHITCMQKTDLNTLISYICFWTQYFEVSTSAFWPWSWSIFGTRSCPYLEKKIKLSTNIRKLGKLGY